MTDERKELYSAHISAGSRTYFFDVKVSSDGTKYLTINEARRADGDTFTRNRVMVFEEYAGNFLEALSNAMKAMK